MNLRRRWLALTLSLCIALGLGLPAYAQTARSIPTTLQSAVDRGLVDYDASGTGASSGDSVKLRVKKTAKAKGPLDLTLPEGSVLRSSSGGAQSMVVASVRGVDVGGGLISPTSRIHLAGANPVTLILSAFCAEFEKDNPSTSTSFTLESPDPMLACITRRSRSLSIPARQAAVWIRTDGVSFQHVNEKFSVSPGEWSAAQQVVAQCSSTVH